MIALLCVILSVVIASVERAGASVMCVKVISSQLISSTWPRVPTFYKYVSLPLLSNSTRLSAFQKHDDMNDDRQK